MNKSFRGQIQPDGQKQIRLSTNNGLTGYKIIKFEALSSSPAGNSPESVLKIFTKEQESVTGSIDFSDPTLLAAMFYEGNNNNTVLTQVVTIFDNMTFNQDIYVTATSTDGNMNYYVELEQVKLSKDEAAVATLKDMRAGPDTNFGS